MRSIGSACSKNIEKRLAELASFNSTPDQGITRVALSSEDRDARNLIKHWMKELGLNIHEDEIGNIYGRLEGSDPSASPVWSGSHIDTVLHGGKFDGMLGVIGALEAIRAIKERSFVPRRNIEVVVFTSEEPTAFGMGCLGSRALTGELTLDKMRKLKDQDGKSLLEGLIKLGYISESEKLTKSGPLLDLIRTSGEVHAFLELHIEQGAVLENLGIPIGLVTSICAPTDLQICITGKQAHAGATPMDLRQDAMMATAEIALYLEHITINSKSPHTVGTVGKVMVHPNASNAIPGVVNFSIDLRDSNFKIKDDILKDLLIFIERLQIRRKIHTTIDVFNHDKPEDCDSEIVDLLRESCEMRQIPFHKMVSGAYHDAMHIAHFAPIGMIFVPSKDGISHSPKEWTDTIDIVKGVNILTDTIFHLANS